MKIEIQKIEAPRDIKELSENLYMENFNLVLNKYIECDEDDKVKSDTFMFKFKKVKFDTHYKFIKKQKYLVDRFAFQGYNIARYKFKPYDRIIVGLGQESVREVSMTLHWIYGIPYIPGQAIKGMLSNWMIGEEADKDDHFKLIFGDEDNKGSVIFMDSYPEDSSFRIKPDIINTHYPNYYMKNKELPSDWQVPNLIHFLTLSDVTFNIYLIYLEKDIEKMTIKGKTLEEWLKEAFRYGGIGAKTSLGYGTGYLRSIKGDRKYV